MSQNKTGRNDPCPCRSGKKFKRCCEKESYKEMLSKRNDCSKLIREYITSKDKKKLLEVIGILESFNNQEYLGFIDFLIDEVGNKDEKIANNSLSNITERDNYKLLARLIQKARQSFFIEISQELPIKEHLQKVEIGINACQEAITISKKLTDKNCEAYFLKELASSYYSIKDYIEAKNYLLESLQLYRKLEIETSESCLDRIAMVLNDLGLTQRELKELKEAKISLLESLEIIKKLLEKDPKIYTQLYATALNTMAVILRDLKNWKEGKKYLIKSLDSYRKLELEYSDIYMSNIALVLNNLSAFQSELREWDDAENSIQEALKIYKILEEKEPGKFLLQIALTLNNLGMMQSKLKEFEEAKKHYQEALSINRELEKLHPEKFLFDVSDNLNNIGILQMDLKEFEEAKISFYESLEIKRKLAEKNPDTFLYQVAMTLNNIGMLHRQLHELYKSKNAYKEALEIRKQLAEANPKAFLPHYADSLNNMGNLYRNLNEMREAENLLTKALYIYRELAEQNPEVFLFNVAGTLNSLGGVQFELNDLKNAEKSIKESIEINKKLAKHNPKEFLPQVATSLANLGTMQKSLKEFSNAKITYEEALEAINRIKKFTTPENQEHLHIFKSNIEMATMWLIQSYYEENDVDRVLSLIETRRNAEIIASKEEFKNETTKIQGNHIVISIESTPEYCFFIVTSEKENKISKLAFNSLSNVVNPLMSVIDSLLNDFNNSDLNKAKTDITNAGKELFALLPDEIKEIFNSTENQTIYLSLGSNLVNIPFEFMVNEKGEFIGQKHLLPRVQGITMLNKLQEAYREVNFNKNKLIISDPSKDLQYAREEGKYIKRKLSERFEKVIFLFKNQATKENIFENLTDDIALFHFTGHGIDPDGLELAFGINNIYSRHINGKNFINNPLIFINSCMSGTTKYLGGGKFQGMPAIFLKSGAQAVISCVYPVIDRFSMDFAKEVYDNLLQNKTIGESVMQSRQDKEFPWEWGLHMFHGNPELKIRIQEELTHKLVENLREFKGGI